MNNVTHLCCYIHYEKKKQHPKLIRYYQPNKKQQKTLIGAIKTINHK